MEQIVSNFTFDQSQNSEVINVIINPPEVRIVQSVDQTCYVYHRNQLVAQYEKRDNYARNMIVVQLFISHHVSQKCLSDVFQLTVQHISTLVRKYRQTGSAGIQNRIAIRIGNNQKIKGKIADAIEKQLNVSPEEKPTYVAIAKTIKQKYGVQLSPQRISCWWRESQAEKDTEKDTTQIPEQLKCLKEDITQKDKHKKPQFQDSNEINDTADTSLAENKLMNEAPSESLKNETSQDTETPWQANNIAGSFILYAMLNASQFLAPFMANIKDVSTTGSKTVERVMLTLFFLHALRLKSIEKTKHLLAAHFAPLVLGSFCRLQSLRYAIDAITEHENFDNAVTEHYQSLSQYTELGDDIYYTDGHFSCYYGKYAIPKGYDARRKQAQRGRNSVYLHNSLGHNILSFESPTNTTLSNDIVTLINEMKTAYGEVKGKNLMFDRGGYSADCFKQITKSGMCFTTYLKHRKKQQK
ncbi:MAG: hypothetical protein L3J01_03630 [Thiomicrorhabdus sp.]|nr:hypothetical protein [Thiomicrorhabdus sp.]